MTYILAFDTTLGACSVALLQDGNILSSKKEVRARGHVERLLPMVDEVINDAGIKLETVDLIAVTIGPGTFAGVRIGLSAAKGMALALDVPVIPVTSLEAIAFAAFRDNDVLENVNICIDARRGEFYMQSFQSDMTRLNEAEAVPLADIENRQYPNAPFVGSGGKMIAKIIEIDQDENHEQYDSPHAENIALYAYQIIDKVTNADTIKPLYLRAPDAKPPSASLVPEIKS
ncbi:tRNA (adenosine(37)-N6)-threonylcarbamoyltransferase complex dimerization subunit type 1 TsaB [Pseudemcibacter aquimaris]|uniref:tRNA (adenosine(37)-N6)-threonylcarbamoyltransferase complex dimerization subunit type 1 TsaB n=1 Tax=Pseudemcibacter aquimaris TaxID=2857064 RepID=UPI0020127AE9|nr:tRNA (adenosine(37)-N6)-threonylcarbamoyltransferase complex dimerization subunit type 1 TsaB [Pseudemcibacter aquimaris]MCC3862355.1 tRNA (adenosine(37)-N6)-threonylcarbamoyltransferase complex dimerization subunit type 1 TsaB [Pseudemcibacter aquimaris]WDU59214.1 tRNA (adenosine(37)-N6)-threonylcarbamoyltransferase complex dimerization subunit type 1 TsaB [Pseudemcibacter aquimaris]